jgi:hypothetical protein
MWSLMKLRTLVKACLVFILICESDGQTQEKKGTLTISVTDNRGARIPAGRLSISSPDGSIKYSSEFQNLGAISLPYGRYIVSFKTDFFQMVSREVLINQPECFMALAAHMDRVVLDIPHDPISVSVRIKPEASCSPGGFLWAKIIGIFSDYEAERRFGPSGFALFEPVEFGKYQIIVIDGTSVRASSSFETGSSVTAIDLPLSPCK